MNTMNQLTNILCQRNLIVGKRHIDVPKTWKINEFSIWFHKNLSIKENNQTCHSVTARLGNLLQFTGQGHVGREVLWKQLCYNCVLKII